jgi:tripartite-type tricarboxylate transporter receptor subunit TctC
LDASNAPADGASIQTGDVATQSIVGRPAREDEMLKMAFSLAMLVLMGVAASADPVADFYRGRQVSLIVGYGTGGGYDVYGRLMARHLGRHIPGQPNVVVQNMPGAGSLRAVNHLYTTAPKDGSAIASFGRDMPLIGIIGHNPNVRFEARKFTWLGSSSSYANDAYMLLVRKDAATNSIADARRQGGVPLILGATGEGSTGNDVPILLRDALGLNIKLITGYPDGNAIVIAVERKELDGRLIGLSATRSTRPDWLKPESGMRVLLQFARRTRHPLLPDVPTARELAPDDRSRALIGLAELPYQLSRPFAAPPGVPADRARALQAAFQAVHRDPLYLEDAMRLKVDVSPIGAEDVVRAIDEIAGAPPDLLDYMRKLLSEQKSGG